LDVDAPSELNLLKTYFNTRHIFGRIDEIRRSSRGHGYHIIVRHTNLNFRQILRLRHLLNDDEQRLKFDAEADKKPKSILFRVKNGCQVELLDERDLIRLPFWVVRGVEKRWKKRRKFGEQFSSCRR
jgi:hypothetical protein